MHTYQTGRYDFNSLIPQEWRGWDDYRTRLNRYEVYDGYYHNLQYHALMTYSETLKFTEKLYKHVRGVYNPVMRLIELYVAKTWPGALDTQDASSGAIPLTGFEDERMKDAIIALWKTSRWGLKKNLAIRNGSRFGDGYFKIVDDIERGMVYLEALDPRKVKAKVESPTGRLDLIDIEYYIRDQNGRLRLYTERITPESYTTQLDGTPMAMNRNGRGETVAEWENEYGFVPVVHIQHRDVGLQYGATPFYGSIHKINELNDLASIINDGGRKQVQLPLWGKGMNTTNVDIGQDNSTNTLDPRDTPRKDTMAMLRLPAQAEIGTLTPTINLADAMNMTREVLQELERDMPELALHRIREGGNLTAPGIRSAYDDAIARFMEARGAYDSGLVEAHKMGVAIGGFRGYDGYAGFNLQSLDTGQLEHQIDERPIIGDTLSKREKIELTSQAANAHPSVQRLIFNELGYSEDEIKSIIDEQLGSQPESNGTSEGFTQEDVNGVSAALAEIGMDNTIGATNGAIAEPAAA